MKVKLILGIVFVVAGLIFSLFIPVMAIVGEVVIVELPYRNEIPGGPNIPSYQGSDELWQEFVSPGNYTVTDFYLGMVKTTDSWDGKTVFIEFARSDLSFVHEDYAVACLQINVISIQEIPTWVEALWIDIWTPDSFDSRHSCWGLSSSPLSDPEFPLADGAPYTITVASQNARPGVHWQLSTVSIPEWNSSEQGSDFSLKLAGIKGAEPTPPPDEPPDEPPPDDQPPVNGDDDITENAGKVMAIFLGPLLFAVGVVVLVSDMEYFKNGMFGYILMAAIWLIAFAVMFILANYYKHGGIPGLVIS